MAKIFLIESSPSDAQSAREAIEAYGDTVDLTGEASQAVDQARALKPDLIVLCVELDTGSGYSICNKLRRDVELGQLPLILTSREATAETFEQHRRLKTHADKYLHKPYAQADLLGAIDGLLGRVAEAAPAPAATTEALVTPLLKPEGEDSRAETPAPQGSPAQEAGTVEIDLTEEAVRSLALAVDPELGIVIDPPVVPTSRESETNPFPETGAAADSAPQSKAQGDSFEAEDIVFDDEAWDISEDEASPPQANSADVSHSETTQEGILKNSAGAASDVLAPTATYDTAPNSETSDALGDQAGREAKTDMPVSIGPEELHALRKELDAIQNAMRHALERLDSLVNKISSP